MNDPAALLCVGGIICITHAVEAVTGFGATILALPLIACMLGIKTAVPILVVLGWIMAACIVWRSRRGIAWKPLRVILLLAGLGLPAGVFLQDHLPEREMKLVLGLFMVGVGVRGLIGVLMRTGHDVRISSGGGRLMSGVLVLGGIFHGAFGTGGPFVVLYASRHIPDKTCFRGTLSFLWLILNSILMLVWTLQGHTWNREIVRILLVALPFLGLGLWMGNHLHHRLHADLFRHMVHAVMVSVGITLFIANV